MIKQHAWTRRTAAALVACLATISPALAADLSWDLSTTNTGGSGIWDTTTANWHTGTGQGGALQVWLPTERARFESGSNVVTLGEDITFTTGWLVVLSDTFYLQSQIDPITNQPYTLTMGSTNGMFDIQTGIGSVISAPLAGHVSFRMVRTRAVTVTGPITGAGTDLEVWLNPGSSAAAGEGLVRLTGHADHGGGTRIAGRLEGGIINPGVLELSGSIAHSNIVIDAYGVLRGNASDHGELTWNLTGDIGELITVNADGQLDLTHLALNLNITGLQTQREYVIADYSAAGASGVVGTFASLQGLGLRWGIDYDGTTASGPNKIVLFELPEPSCLALLLLGGLTALRRRCRA